jgi:diacylglycerol kinase family enzyme
MIKSSSPLTFTVAVDGELVQMQPPLKFSVKKSALKVMVPNVVTPV